MVLTISRGIPQLVLATLQGGVFGLGREGFGLPRVKSDFGEGVAMEKGSFRL